MSSGSPRRVCIIMPPAYGLFDQRTNIPLGPLYVAAVLEREGHDVSLISLLGHDIPASWPRADLYAMGFATPQTGAAKGILELIRNQHHDAKVLAAGIHPTVEPYQTLQMGFDSVLIGEAEKTILEILADLPDPKRVYHGLACECLDEIPFPARHLLPWADMHNDAAAVFSGKKHGYVAGIIGSRGCPNWCSFCANPRLSHTRYRSAGNIVAEMRSLVDRGIDRFKFQDDTFALNAENVIALGEAAAKEFEPGQIATRMMTRADSFSERIIPALKQIGLEVVAFGIESGSQEILDISHKNVTVEQSELALKIAHDAGFAAMAFFVFGLPGECARTVDETIEFLHRNKQYMHAAVFSTFVPYAGCDIARRPEFYRMHILDRGRGRYWTTQKKTILALPYDTSFREMMYLMHRSLAVFAELGYAKVDWENDL